MPDAAVVDAGWVAEHDWNLIVGGVPRPAADGRVYENWSPVSEDVICSLPDGGEADVDRAVAAGQAAVPDWAALAPRERAAVVRQLATIARAHEEELAALDAIDVGNAITPMVQDVRAGANAIEFMADAAVTLLGETLPHTPTHLHYTKREPFGVVARIIAFNHPIMFALQKVAAPLVAGNAVIIKPSDISALSALRMGELFADVLPPGLLSVLVGKGPDLPQAIVRHPEIRRIGFIGSETTGRAIQRTAAEVAVKDITLELGGKNAIIVCEDVDVAEAAAGVVKGMNFTGWQSQSCSSTSRLLVHESIADDLIDRIIEQVSRIRIGHPLDPSTEMGTLASRAQLDKSLGYIAEAKSSGARLRYGGGRPRELDDRPGLYLEPTIFDDVAVDSQLAREEVFGPVLSVFRWTDEGDAVRLANSLRVGLTGAVWTRDVARAHRLAGMLEAGYIWINDAAVHYVGIPFGGYKGSGIGKEESIEELLSYTQLKAVNLRIAP